jgi:hypothetical protein
MLSLATVVWSLSLQGLVTGETCDSDSSVSTYCGTGMYIVVAGLQHQLCTCVHVFPLQICPLLFFLLNSTNQFIEKVHSLQFVHVVLRNFQNDAVYRRLIHVSWAVNLRFCFPNLVHFLEVHVPNSVNLHCYLHLDPTEKNVNSLILFELSHSLVFLFMMNPGPHTSFYIILRDNFVGKGRMPPLKIKLNYSEAS